MRRNLKPPMLSLADAHGDVKVQELVKELQDASVRQPPPPPPAPEPDLRSPMSPSSVSDSIVCLLRRPSSRTSAQMSPARSSGSRACRKQPMQAAPSDRHVPWVPSAERDAASEDPGLAELLRKVRASPEP